MFAQPQGGDGSHAVHVIRRGDGDGIDGLAHLIEHFAPVAIELGVIGAIVLRGPILQRLVFPIQRVRVDVAQGDNIAPQTEGAVGVAVALSTHPDAGNVDAIVGALCAQEVGRAECCCAGQHRG